MQPRLPAMLDRPVAFGRLDTEIDEETTGADRLKSLVDRGATGVAADVWLSADGVAMIDPTGRVPGRLRRRSLGRLADAEVDASIPRLSGLYPTLGPDLAISIDVRDPSAFELILAEARAVDAEDRLWLCHPSVATLTSWRPQTSARLINTATYHGIDGGLERRAAELEQRNIDGIRLPHGDWTGGRVTLLHRFARL
ncbi:MAG: hypothetical protein AAFO29_24220, partial [Actinomycetota bacterium]